MVGPGQRGQHEVGERGEGDDHVAGSPPDAERGDDRAHDDQQAKQETWLASGGQRAGGPKYREAEEDEERARSGERADPPQQRSGAKTFRRRADVIARGALAPLGSSPAYRAPVYRPPVGSRPVSIGPVGSRPTRSAPVRYVALVRYVAPAWPAAIRVAGDAVGGSAPAALAVGLAATCPAAARATPRSWRRRPGIIGARVAIGRAPGGRATRAAGGPVRGDTAASRVIGVTTSGNPVLTIAGTTIRRAGRPSAARRARRCETRAVGAVRGPARIRVTAGTGRVAAPGAWSGLLPRWKGHCLQRIRHEA
jgi:hypothetical protein